MFLSKHKRYVNEVYPSNPGEEGPIHPKLGLLTTYVKARPVKLEKVLGYLECKVKIDLDRERSG